MPCLWRAADFPQVFLHFLLTESRIGKAARAYLIKPNSGAAHFAASRHICRLLLQKETKIIIGCAVLALVIIAAAITGIKITDLQRQNTFVDQVNKLSQIVDAEYISDIDRDEFNTFIDSRVCKGKYAKLENAVKSYYKDLYEIQFKSEDAITNSAYDKMLLADNLISDGPDFENSRAELSTLLQTLQDCSAQYSELITAEKAKSYFDETKLSAKYETLFNDSVSVAASETENIYLTSLENSEKIRFGRFRCYRLFGTNQKRMER